MKSRPVAGVDEAGRGPLAGPVCVAAVILDPCRPVSGLADSKKLSAAKRERLAIEIQRHALAWKVVRIDVATIDRLNILQATLLGMRQAVVGLSPAAGEVLVDGNRCPDFGIPARAVIGGDGLHDCISAASILAKTSRDHYMCEQHRKWPRYGFDRHKGYPTRMHREALQAFGPCPLHRRSFAPVQRVLATVSSKQ